MATWPNPLSFFLLLHSVKQLTLTSYSSHFPHSDVIDVCEEEEGSVKSQTDIYNSLIRDELIQALEKLKEQTESRGFCHYAKHLDA